MYVEFLCRYVPARAGAVGARTSALDDDLAGFPPALVMTAELDTMAAHLTKASATVRES
ncbi:hypothetical protein [Amycolatopsis sp. cmx-8-4]|uniref:hypothetical protein n=1 Tax=Amycolatopsis sp. cmx-8-4 TaxID=2790947 RepID=UPI00397CA7AD